MLSLPFGPVPAVSSGSPITARVLRLVSLIATAMPAPTDLPLATPPAQLTFVSRLPALTSTRPPSMLDPAASWASVSLSCLKNEKVPPTATLPALAPACEKLRSRMVSRAPDVQARFRAGVEIDAGLDDRLRRVVEEVQHDRAAHAALLGFGTRPGRFHRPG